MNLLGALGELAEMKYQDKVHLDTKIDKNLRLGLISCHMTKRLNDITEFEDENISEDNIEALVEIANCLDRWIDNMIEKGEKNGN